MSLEVRFDLWIQIRETGPLDVFVPDSRSASTEKRALAGPVVREGLRDPPGERQARRLTAVESGRNQVGAR